MDRNAARLEITSQISALAARRNASADDAEKKAIKESILALQDARNAIDVAANDAIGAQVSALVTRLEAVRTRHKLDAASALGRSIDRLRKGAKSKA